ncbi:NUDIX domain-containing protein [Candidatus Microgenomates bacterium]|nr:MAG: NUDIX domain-containing protein [Candidatus Microgenomates bacterium]
MGNKTPTVNVDILVVRHNKILPGLLTEKWLYEGKQIYGVPGREIHFGEKIGETVKRNIKEELGCSVVTYRIISVNANYALGNHYIGIGVVAEIDVEPKNVVPSDWEKWEWFDKDQLPKNLFPPAENVIKSYINNTITVSE